VPAPRTLTSVDCMEAIIAPGERQILRLFTDRR
jgi:hypothetical protein